MGKTLFQKIWESHTIGMEGDRSILYIDRHLIHEVTSPQAFEGLRMQKRKLHAPERVIAVMDHNIATVNQTGPIQDPIAAEQVEALRKNAKAFGVELFEVGDARNGIVHVVGPEQGLTLPGITVVCGDSHTATHGAFGCLAFGIGTSEVEHVFATQTLLQAKPKNMRVRVEGTLPKGVGAKDVILALIRQIGIEGGTGCVLEYCGGVIEAMTMEERMTVCNMSIEGGARAGLIAPDDTTYRYLKDKPRAPKGSLWEGALQHWKRLPSDADAVYDKETRLFTGELAPQVTWGTNPSMVLGVDEQIPNLSDAQSEAETETWQRALSYMDLTQGQPIQGIPIDKVFIGSCTNSRIEDLRQAAQVARGQKVAKHVQALVVPGSGLVRKQAEQEGLHELFQAAGFEWREPGCSMCLGMNPDILEPGERCASTSNRNFEGRQGAGGRTHLLSPFMAAAAAIAGEIADVRVLL